MIDVIKITIKEFKENIYMSEDEQFIDITIW